MNNSAKIIRRTVKSIFVIILTLALSVNTAALASTHTSAINNSKDIGSRSNYKADNMELPVVAIDSQMDSTYLEDPETDSAKDSSDVSEESDAGLSEEQAEVDNDPDIQSPASEDDTIEPETEDFPEQDVQENAQNEGEEENSDSEQESIDSTQSEEGNSDNDADTENENAPVNETEPEEGTVSETSEGEAPIEAAPDTEEAVMEEPLYGATTGSEPLLEGNVYSVGTPDELLWIASNTNSGNTFSGYTIEITDDIDLGNSEWISIGYNLNNYFSGVFDGNDHVIKNAALSGSVDSYSIINAPRHTTGLFGVCKDATIKNLALENMSFSISNESGYTNSYSSIDATCVYAGVVSGYSVNSVFQNITLIDCNVKAYTGAESANAYAGGICGYTKNSDFVHCGNENTTVEGKSQSLENDAIAGGIAGELSGEGTIRQSYSTGAVSCGAVNAGAYAGGIAGKTTAQGNTLSSIRDCYNTGTISHAGSWLETCYMGGIIGYSSSTVNRCYNAGSVVANTNTVSAAYLAGIAGNGTNASSVSNSAVMTDRLSGGTSRIIIAGAGAKENNISYSGLSATNDTNARYGIDSFYGSSLYIESLGWNFTNIWLENETDFPELRYIDADLENDINLVEEAAAYVDIIYANGDSHSKVTQDITLLSSPNEASVNWTSSNPSVISSETGAVTRQEEDYQIKMTASISSGDYGVEKIFILNVIGTYTGTEEPIDTSEWAMDLDSARSFVALMRGRRFRDIPVNDPTVQVLIGQNIEEDDVIATLAEVMSFWEVPEESEYLKSKMGDIVGYLKSGEDKVMSSMVSDISKGLVTWDSEADTGKMDKINVAKMFLKIDERTYETITEYTEGYKAIKGLYEYQAEADSPVLSALDLGDRIGGVFNYIIKYSGPQTVEPEASLTCGKVSRWIKNAIEAFQIIDAWNKTTKNSVKEYLKLYHQNRPYYSSCDDEAFRLKLDTHALTNFTGNEEMLDNLAETLYQLEEKVAPNAFDEYKIIIRCPVNVSVFDSEGRIVGRVTNNKVDTSIVNSLKIEVGGESNDEKTIYFQDNEPYVISMTGTDQGTMSVSIENMENGILTSHDYNDISLEDGKEMTMSVSSESLSEELPVIYNVGDGAQSAESVSADQSNEKYLLTIYSCLSDEDGNVTLNSIGGDHVSEYVASGTALKSIISPNEGYLFSGLYTDITCTQEYTESSMPAESLTIYALFKENSSGITITQQPVDAVYEMGDSAQALSVSVKESSDFKYQWYSCNEDGTGTKKIPGATQPTFIPDTEVEGIFYYYVQISVIAGTTTKTLDSDIARITINKKETLGEGTLGETVEWTLSADGILVISGEGEASITSEEDIPWKANCSDIKKIVVEKSITKLPNNIFTGCNQVESMEVPFIGVSRDSVGSDGVLGAVFGTTSNEGVVQYYELEGTSLHGYRYAIPQTLKEISITDADVIPFGAFCNCSFLESVNLGNTIQTISEYSFYQCSGLKDIVIPSSVTEIQEGSLKGCSGLNSLTIPFIGTNADQNGSFSAVFGAVFGRSSEGTVQYYMLQNSSLSGYKYDIPELLTKVTVTNETDIPLGAFSNCVNLEEMTLNSGITQIDLYAFYNCSSLTDIYYQDFESRWNAIDINSSGNTVLDNVLIHYLQDMRVIGHSLSLLGNIGINYYFDIDEAALSEDDAHILFTLPDGTAEKSYLKDASVVKVNDVECRRFSCEIASTHMTGDVQAQLIRADGSSSEVDHYSAKTYADRIIANEKHSEAFEKAIPLVKRMLNYGGYAQIYFQYDNSPLANKDLDAEETDLSSVSAQDLSAYAFTKTGENEGLTYYGSSLILKSETTIRHYFLLDSGHTIDEYTFMKDTEELNPVKYGKYYYVDIPDIASDELDSMIVVSVGDFRITYGALSYAYSKLGKEDTEDSLKDVLKAMVLYNREANSYFGG